MSINGHISIHDLVNSSYQEMSGIKLFPTQFCDSLLKITLRSLVYVGMLAYTIYSSSMAHLPS